MFVPFLFWFRLLLENYSNLISLIKFSLFHCFCKNFLSRRRLDGMVFPFTSELSLVERRQTGHSKFHLDLTCHIKL
jgi:hypothetical protein